MVRLKAKRCFAHLNQRTHWSGGSLPNRTFCNTWSLGTWNTARQTWRAQGRQFVGLCEHGQWRSMEWLLVAANWRQKVQVLIPAALPATIQKRLPSESFQCQACAAACTSCWTNRTRRGSTIIGFSLDAQREVSRTLLAQLEWDV